MIAPDQSDSRFRPSVFMPPEKCHALPQHLLVDSAVFHSVIRPRERPREQWRRTESRAPKPLKNHEVSLSPDGRLVMCKQRTLAVTERLPACEDQQVALPFLSRSL